MSNFKETEVFLGSYSEHFVSKNGCRYTFNDEKSLKEFGARLNRGNHVGIEVGRPSIMGLTPRDKVDRITEVKMTNICGYITSITFKKSTLWGGGVAINVFATVYPAGMFAPLLQKALDDGTAIFGIRGLADVYKYPNGGLIVHNITKLVTWDLIGFTAEAEDEHE